MNHVKSIAIDRERIEIKFAEKQDQTVETRLLGEAADDIISENYQKGYLTTMTPGKMVFHLKAKV